MLKSWAAMKLVSLLLTLHVVGCDTETTAIPRTCAMGSADVPSPQGGLL